MLTLCDGRFDIITVCNIGIEIINLLEKIHSKGYIYLDLKADNICILFHSLSKTNIRQRITIVDYGSCCEYVDEEKNHLTPKRARKRYGNINFASINSLSGNPVSRRDDIEILCYFLLSLYLGQI